MSKYVVISDKGRQFIEKGQNWMYRNNLVSDSGNLIDGDVVEIHGEDGSYLASGFYSEVSHIVVRIVTRNQKEVINDVFFRNTIMNAYNYRKEVVSDNLDNCRIIFGEGDNLPGLVIDRYNDILVSQISISAIEKRKEMIYQIICDILKQDNQMINCIYERNEIAIRKKEGLSAYKKVFSGKDHPLQTIINENGVLMNVDVENGQKTGYFLDQKFNRKLVRDMAENKRVLDCFCHTAGFAINAAYGKAKSVTAVDLSPLAIENAKKNAKLNNLENKIKFVVDDVFNYLDNLQKGQFDIIILDPPAFTKSRSTVNKAYNGYKEINYKALKALDKGSYLITCSCSRYMEMDLFEQMINEAASEASVNIKLISESLQSPDHRINENMSESLYLKFYVYQII